jgi:hypothetical protein
MGRDHARPQQRSAQGVVRGDLRRLSRLFDALAQIDKTAGKTPQPAPGLEPPPQEMTLPWSSKGIAPATGLGLQ